MMEQNMSLGYRLDYIAYYTMVFSLGVEEASDVFELQLKPIEIHRHASFFMYITLALHTEYCWMGVWLLVW